MKNRPIKEYGGATGLLSRREFWVALIFMAILLQAIFVRVHVFSLIGDDRQPDDSYVDYAYHVKAYSNGCPADSCTPDYVIFYAHWLYVIAGAIVNSFVGNPLLSLRFISLFSDLLSMCMLFAIARDLWDDRLALASVFIYSLSHTAVLYSSLALTESMFNLLAILTVFLTVRKKFMPALVAAGLASLTRANGVILFAVVLSYIVYLKRGRVWFVTFVACTCILMFLSIPWLFTLYFKAMPDISFWHAVEHLLSIGRVIDWGFIILVPPGFLVAIKNGRMLPILALCILVVVSTIAFQTHPQFTVNPRFYIPLVPWVSILLALTFFGVMEKFCCIKSLRLKKAVLTFYTLSFILYFVFLSIEDARGGFIYYMRQDGNLSEMLVSQFRLVPQRTSLGFCSDDYLVRDRTSTMSVMWRYFIDKSQVRIVNCNKREYMSDFLMITNLYASTEGNGITKRGSLFRLSDVEYPILRNYTIMSSAWTSKPGCQHEVVLYRGNSIS